MLGVTDHFVSVPSPDEPHTPSKAYYKRDTRCGHPHHSFTQPSQRWKARRVASNGLGCIVYDAYGILRRLSAVFVQPAAQEDDQSEDFQADKQKPVAAEAKESLDCTEREL